MSPKKRTTSQIPDFRTAGNKSQTKNILTPGQAERLEFIYSSGSGEFKSGTDIQMMTRKFLGWDDPGQKTVRVTEEAKEILFNANGTVKDEFVR